MIDNFSVTNYEAAVFYLKNRRSIQRGFIFNPASKQTDRKRSADEH
jgi:hypothetical protein